MTFDANRDLRIDARRDEDGTFVLRTDGLKAHKRPELEIVGVPDEAQARNAAVIINQVASYTVNEKAIAVGELVGVTSPNGSLIARLVTSPAAPRSTGLGRVFGRGTPALLRIEEPLEGMEPLKTLLTTVMLWRANAALDEGDAPRAIEALEDAIAFFPGDPERRAAPSFGAPHNWQNHLAYSVLSQLLAGEDKEAAVTALENALARCASYELERLGDPASALAHLDTAALTARARTLLLASDDAHQAEEVTDHVVLVRSPIWRDDGGRAARRAAVVPDNHVYSLRVLLTDAALLSAAVDLVVTNARRPAVTLFRVAPTLDFWEGGAGDAPLAPTGLRYEPGDQLVSLALAHVARLAAAGMSASEVRAFCGLAADRPAYDAATRKYDELEANEAHAQMRALPG